jgi:lysine biosynthesis enzyme LysX
MTSNKKFKIVGGLIYDRIMKLGLIYDRINFEEKQIIKACEKQKIECIRFNNQELSLNLSTQKDLEPIVDLFIQRTSSLLQSNYSTAILENKGYKIINNSICMSRCEDKIINSLYLSKNGIPAPMTYVSFTPEAAVKVAKDKLHYPIISKPIVGSMGQLVAKLNDNDASAAFFQARERLGDNFQQIFYTQEYIDSKKVNKESPTDIKVFYLGGDCIAAIGRFHLEGDFQSKIAIDGPIKSYKITPNLEKMCKKIAQIMQGEILGIDLMESKTAKDGYVCIGMNAVPEFEAISKATEIDIGEKIVQYLKTRM